MYYFYLCSILWLVQLLYTLAYKLHFLYSEIEAKIEYDLYMGQTKRVSIFGIINGGNTIILFFKLINKYTNNKLIY